jgi:hypothetical protein
VRAPALAGVVVLPLALGAACDPPVIKVACVPLTPRELDEAASCLGPPVTDTGLQACGVGANEVPVCLIGPGGRIYRAFVGVSAAIRGDGWTHSAYGTMPGTSSMADLNRCAKLLPVDGGTPLPTCP